METKDLEVFKNEICFYETENGTISVDVKIENNTIWLTQKQISDLFEIDTKTVDWHLQNIFLESELDKEPTTW